MFGFIKKMFVGLLASVVSASSYTKCVPLSNQKCTNKPTIINLHPNEYTQGLYYYQLVVNFDKFVGSCNTLNDFANKVCVSNKIEALNLSVFNMITGINDSKTLAKHMLNVNENLVVENVIQIKVKKR